jgi:hypothetical protein
VSDDSIQDEPPPAEVPQGRRRPRLTRLAPDVQGADREALSLWMKATVDDVRREYEERIAYLKKHGEHPSPLFADMVRNYGMTGLSVAAAARMMNISQAVIKNHYLDDYELGRAELVAKMASNYIRIGSSTDPFLAPTAAKVAGSILEKFGGSDWKPAAKRLEVEDTTKQAPLLDTSNMSYEDRQAIREIMERQLLQQKEQVADEGDSIEE